MGASLVVERIVNAPVPSNCYIVHSTNSDECLVIDPSHQNSELLEKRILSKKLRPRYIILTHEHFDHISSVEYLRQAFACKLVATTKASQYITDPRKNCSLYYNGNGYTCSPANIVIEHNMETLLWNDMDIEFYLTPGHSEGSVCFSIDNLFFTGDTLMLGHDAVVKLPGGNKETLRTSLQMILPLIREDMTICPGHGREFTISEIQA